MIWIWIALGIVVLVAAFIVSTALWHPEKGTTRSMFSHWILSLMRYYEDAASLSIVLADSRDPLLVLRRTGTLGDSCTLLIEIVDRSLLPLRREALNQIRMYGASPIRLPACSSTEAPTAVKIDVQDIWKTSAGNPAARAVAAILRAAGIEENAKFDLSFDGKRSRERLLEARERQKSGQNTLIGPGPVE